MNKPLRAFGHRAAYAFSIGSGSEGTGPVHGRAAGKGECGLSDLTPEAALCGARSAPEGRFSGDFGIRNAGKGSPVPGPVRTLAPVGFALRAGAEATAGGLFRGRPLPVPPQVHEEPPQILLLQYLGILPEVLPDQPQRPIIARGGSLPEVLQLQILRETEH